MKKKSKRRFVRKGSIDGYMLSDEQMSVLIKKSIVSVETKYNHTNKAVNKNDK